MGVHEGEVVLRRPTPFRYLGIGMNGCGNSGGVMGRGTSERFKPEKLDVCSDCVVGGSGFVIELNEMDDI